MTLQEAIRFGEAALKEDGMDDPRWNAERLLQHALQLTRAELYSDLRRELNAEEAEAFQLLLSRRSRGEPLAYIEGTQEFFGREFCVGRGVLIPRPETEEIIRASLELPLAPAPRILDLGAGSGCVGVTLALEIPDARVIALEHSRDALLLLLRNAKGQVEILRGDLFFPPFQPTTFDLVVANPPYVTDEEYRFLPAETRHEPREALVTASVAGTYSSLLAISQRLLKPGGYLVFEIGAGQHVCVEELLTKRQGVSKIGSRSDFRNILRTFILQKDESSIII